jgi:hypothetical protein
MLDRKILADELRQMLAQRLLPSAVIVAIVARLPPRRFFYRSALYSEE